MRLHLVLVPAFFAILGFACSSSDDSGTTGGAAGTATGGSAGDAATSTGGSSGTGGSATGGSSGTGGKAGTGGGDTEAGTGGGDTEAGTGGGDPEAGTGGGDTEAGTPEAGTGGGDTEGGTPEGGVVATHKACKDLLKVANDIIAAKGCTNTADLSTTIAHCEDVYTNKTQCTDAADAFVACVQDAPDTSWKCDDSGAPDIGGDLCFVEQDAVKACSGFASSSGTGCYSDPSDDCQKCIADNCCNEVLACTDNVECVAIYDCTSGEFLQSNGGCDTADGGFTVECAGQCYTDHPDGQAAFAAAFFAGPDAGTACISANCQTQCGN